MSASETMHACRPSRLITSRSTSAPPKITSWRPTGRPGRSARSDHAFGTEHVAPASHRLRAQHRVVDPLPVVVHQAQFQAGQRGDGAGQADEPSRRAEVGQGRDRLLGAVQRAGDRLHRRRHLLRRGRIAAQEALRQPDAADVERHREDLAAGLGHDLRGPAADVEDDDRAGCGRQVPGGAGIRQPPLLDPGEQLCRRSDDVGRGEQEVLAVGGVADGRGGHQAGPLHTFGIHDGAVGA